MNKTNFNLEERSRILASILKLRQVVEQLSNDLDDAPDDENVQENLMKKLDKTSSELEELENQYTQGLIFKTISRCPFSNQPFGLSMDTFGLDGLWWDSEQPVRAIKEEIKTFFAITGSVNIVGEIPNIPFPIKPGPAVPWVSPRLLANENIIAVLSHVKVGVYDAYVTVYYSNDNTVEIERINTWGTDSYFAEDKDGIAIIGSTYDDIEEYDFDLAPWIKKGKLLWIQPEDENLTIQHSIDNCPFLNLKGYKYPVILRNGKLENCIIELAYDEDTDHETENEHTTPHFCPNCGKAVIKGAKFCGNCGNRLN